MEQHRDSDGEGGSEEAGGSGAGGTSGSGDSIQVRNDQASESILSVELNEPNDPMTKMVRGLDGDYFTLTEAARAVDRSKRTLRSWIYGEVEGLQPGGKVEYGDTFVYLYTLEDINRIKTNINRRAVIRDYTPRKRVSKYTDEQRHERAKLMSRRFYWNRTKEEAEFYRNQAAFDKANNALEQIESEISAITKEAQ
jgi:hypothetical protein